MRIMVFDVPAVSGGALTVLNQYYDAAVKDKENEWVFVVSTPKLKDTGHIKVLNYPWIKKSWFHRLYFDGFVAHKLVAQYKADEILSLQNVVIPKIEIKQRVYMHQALPFVEKRYKINENFLIWVYQNVISRIIFRSIKKADKVIVQTKWIRDVAIEKTGVSKEKFVIKQPDLNIEVKKHYQQDKQNKISFFYPASSLDYKNHKVIIDAIENMPSKYRDKFKIIFTLKGDENDLAQSLYKRIKKQSLPVKLVGSLAIEEVYDYYSKSILIFPSYIESFGLPLLEAKEHSCPIIASNCAFSREILDGYNKARFFDPFDKDELHKYIIEFLELELMKES